MQGLTVRTSASLSQVLRPLQQSLDEAWWYLGGSGVHLPAVDVPTPALPSDKSPNGIERWKQQNADWLSAVDRQLNEYANWVDDEAGYRVGIPGWYSRYVDVADSCWVIYFACRGTSIIPRQTLELIDAFCEDGDDWFGDASKWQLPDDVLLVCRDVDGAYWDLFFRHDRDADTVRQHLQNMDDTTFNVFIAPPSAATIPDGESSP